MYGLNIRKYITKTFNWVFIKNKQNNASGTNTEIF